MTYYEYWRGDDYCGIVDEYDMKHLCEADSWATFVQLNNLP